MDPLVLSIVVPVYNVEAYIEACVESLIPQSMKQVEVILVDDGSTDRSGAICDALARKYTCVQSIHRANSGVSVARNCGMNRAKGKYIVFVDADDCIAPDGIEAVLHWAQTADADICFLQIQDFYSDGTIKDHGENIKISGVRQKSREEVFRYLSSRPKYPGSAWAKVFRRDFLSEKKFRFIEGRTNGEDLAFVMECLLAAQRFDVLEIPFYQYRRNRMGSATYRVDSQSYRQLCAFVAEWAERLTQYKKATDRVSTYAMAFVAYEYAILLWRSIRLSDESLEYAVGFLKEYRWVMRYARNVRIKAISVMQRLFGVRRTAWVLKMIKSRGEQGNK